MKVKFWLKTAGYCLSKENIVIRKGKNQEIKFPATYGVIQHPREGWILFDTGYTQRFHTETARFPARIYAMLTPTTINPEEEAVAEVREMGIDPKEIMHIIISHFHADHVGGLKDFPNARFYCTEKAFHQAINFRGFAAVRRGILPGLLPDDLAERVDLVDKSSRSQIKDKDLGEMTDLFGDGSVLLPFLPGHAAGQIGALLETEKGKVFMAADSAWVKENYEAYHLPSPVVRLFFDSWSDYTSSLRKVRSFWKSHPEIPIIPTHCEETRLKLLSQQTSSS